MCSQNAFHTTWGPREASTGHTQPLLSSSSCSDQHHIQVAAFCFLVTLCRAPALDIPNPFSVAAVTDYHKLSSFTPPQVSVSVCGSGVGHGSLGSPPGAGRAAVLSGSSWGEPVSCSLRFILGRIQLLAGDRLKSPFPGWLSAEDCSGSGGRLHCVACGLFPPSSEPTTVNSVTFTLTLRL